MLSLDLRHTPTWNWKLKQDSGLDRSTLLDLKHTAVYGKSNTPRCSVQQLRRPTMKILETMTTSRHSQKKNLMVWVNTTARGEDGQRLIRKIFWWRSESSILKSDQKTSISNRSTNWTSKDELYYRLRWLCPTSTKSVGVRLENFLTTVKIFHSPIRSKNSDIWSIDRLTIPT